MIYHNISDQFFFYITCKRIIVFLDRNLSNYKKEDL